MLTDARYREVQGLFHAHIDGGVSEGFTSMVGRFIENGDISEEEFQLNEATICFIFDADFFTCSVCDWTFPISDMADGDDWQCEDCV